MKSPKTHPRRGAAMVMTIVVIVVASALATAMVHLALQQRRQFETQRRQVQAAWYAQAGLDRAAAMLSRSTDYQGETWTVAETSRSAQMVITIDRTGDMPRMTVVADYPVGDLHRVRCRRELPYITPQGATAVSALQLENRTP